MKICLDSSCEPNKKTMLSFPEHESLTVRLLSEKVFSEADAVRDLLLDLLGPVLVIVRVELKTNDELFVRRRAVREEVTERTGADGVCDCEADPDLEVTGAVRDFGSVGLRANDKVCVRRRAVSDTVAERPWPDCVGDCDINRDLELVAGIDIVASRLFVPPVSDPLNMRDGDCILVALHDAVKLAEGDSTVSLSWLLIENESTRVRRLEDVVTETVKLRDNDGLENDVIDLEKETVLVMHRVDPFIAVKVPGGHLLQEPFEALPLLGL